MPSFSSCVDIGGYTAWSLPSTSWPSSRASAATPPMKVPQMPRICSFMAAPVLAIVATRSTDFGSRGDRFDDSVEHFVHAADAVHAGELALAAVEIDHRRGLLAVHVEAVAHRFGRVVGAAFERGAAGDALDQQRGVDVELHGDVDRLLQP